MLLLTVCLGIKAWNWNGAGYDMPAWCLYIKVLRAIFLFLVWVWPESTGNSFTRQTAVILCNREKKRRGSSWEWWQEATLFCFQLAAMFPLNMWPGMGTENTEQQSSICTILFCSVHYISKSVLLQLLIKLDELWPLNKQQSAGSKPIVWPGSSSKRSNYFNWWKRTIRIV